MKQKPTENPDPRDNWGNRLAFLLLQGPSQELLQGQHRECHDPTQVAHVSSEAISKIQTGWTCSLVFQITHERNYRWLKKTKSLNATAFGYILTWKEAGFIPIIKHNISLKNTCITQQQGKGWAAGRHQCQTAAWLESTGSRNSPPPRHQAADQDTPPPRPSCRNANAFLLGWEVKTRALKSPGWFYCAPGIKKLLNSSEDSFMISSKEVCK